MVFYLVLYHLELHNDEVVRCVYVRVYIYTTSSGGRAMQAVSVILCLRHQDKTPKPVTSNLPVLLHWNLEVMQQQESPLKSLVRPIPTGIK